MKLANYIRQFSELTKDDVSIAGGKGSSLGEMTRAGIPVPPGFVVLTDAFHHYIQSNNLLLEIQAALDSVNKDNTQSVEDVSEKIQALIINGAIDEELRNLLADAFADLDAEFVAVRSSATAEDGKEAAWAGQLDSYLNTTQQSFEENIKRCWASLFSPRAIHYRFDKKFDATAVSVAVVVQEMIDSEVAGVAFSVHPVTEDRQQMLIEAAYGLGEAVVSGFLTPDAYVIDRGLSILDKHIATQVYQLVKGSDGGVVESPIPLETQGIQKLSDAEIHELGALVLSIENHYGFPCDIEWAKRSTKFFILQSRPITTLGVQTAEENTMGIVHASSSSEKLHKESDFEQVWQVNDYSLLSVDLGVTFPFVSMKQWLCSFVDKSWFLTFDHNVGSMHYSQREMELAAYWGKRDFLDSKWFDTYIEKSQALYGKAECSFRQYSEQSLASLDDQELYTVTRELGLLLTDIYGYFNAAQPQCVIELEQELEHELSQTVPEAQVREIFLELTRPEKRSLLDEEEIAWLNLRNEMSDVDTDLDDLLEQHRMRFGILGTADGGTYYSTEYYRDLFAAVNDIEAKERLRSKLEQESIVHEVKHQLIERHGVSEHGRRLATILSSVAHERFELRLRGWMSLDYWFKAFLLQEIERRFGLSTQLSRQLTFQELLGLLLTKEFDEKELGRRNEFFIVGMKNGQIFLETGTEARALAATLLPQSDVDVRELEGQVARLGHVHGRAYVLQWNAPDISELMKAMPEGAIVVAGQTRPQLMPALRKAAAIVTDEGGITSHAAIVSRELGIPCVIGTKIATKVIQTGDEIEVDANKGKILIHKVEE